MQKKNKVFLRNVSESALVSDHVEWQMKIDVIAKITRAMEIRDYYAALTAPCSFFQVLGKQLLGMSKGERADLSPIINKLCSKNLINQTICNEMHDAKNLRNEFEHEGGGFGYSSEQARQAETIVTKALRCVKYLKTKTE
jgi:hypothetical protein